MIDEDSSPEPSDGGGGVEGSFEQGEVRYERQGLLGQGGMGRVYAARDSLLRRQVALKVAATPELAGRLAREAWITAQLEHPGIVAVYDAGETDGQNWYTMRLIRGRTLRERVAACPDLAARLQLMPHLHAACQAVAYAHSMGIVHRDLKPSNIMVGEFGETQVADWGLARPVDDSMADWRRIVDEDAQPDVSGTPRYMSPEQARGAPAGFASDVYCLGAVLHELLAGEEPPPHTGRALNPETLPAEAPRELVAIARRSLQPDSAARYPSAAELAADLDRWLSGRRVHAHEYQPLELLSRLVRAWRAPLAVGAIAFVGLGTVVGYAVHRSGEERAATEASLAVALTQQALAALADDRLPEAHVLAAHALLLGPSPEARGVLAGTAHTNAERVWELALPEACRHTGVLSSDTATLACHAAGKLELWSLDPLERRASLDLTVVEVPVWIGPRLLVATAESMAWVEAGKVVAVVPGGGWRPQSDGTNAFATRGADARSLTPDGGVLDFKICLATRSTTVVAAGELFVGCDDGVLRSYDPQGGPTSELRLGDRPAWSTVSGYPGGLLVGWLQGGVQALEPRTGVWGALLPGFSGSVVALQSVPGTALVLALGESGGPRIWNPDVDAWVGSLPARVSRMFPASNRGEVLLLGDTLQLWRVAATPRPAALHFGSGLSQAVISPSGEALAVALGSGDIVERRLSDGRALRRWHWSEGVAKAVTYLSDEVLLGAAMGAPGRFLGPGDASRSISAGHVLRRLGYFSSGRAWALDYRDAVLAVSFPEGDVSTQVVGPSPFDGSSSPDGGRAVILDNLGGVWASEGGAWVELRRVPDAVAVDIGNGGSPLVTALPREVCIDAHCVSIPEDVVDVAVSTDRVAVATLSGGVWLLDLRTGETVAVLRGHTSRVSSVEFGPDGDWLVSGSWDGTARLWDIHELDMPAEALIERARRVWGLGLEDAQRER
ncbi:hypothetical protein LBMAG42_24690 [Deltaproteobacteria bacterium]|nr:hypothetical protein LBMAG42_24690 [Deltaproteobacteria bacterium]